MLTFRNFIETDDGLVIFLSEGTKHILADNPLFGDVKALIDDRDLDAIPDIVIKADTIKKYTGGNFWVDEYGVIVLNGESIPEALSKRLLGLVDANLPTRPLELFWEKLRQNPSADSRRDLFAFLDHNDIPLTADGDFLAYKRVNEDYTDCRTGRIDNSPGAVVKMDRGEVDPDRENTCSYGLHVAAYAYAKDKYYTNGNLLEVTVNPKDVVAVPVDYNGEKMRVCEYAVKRLAGLPRTEPLAFQEGNEVIYVDPESGNEEEVTIVTAHGGHPNRYDVRAGLDGVLLTGVAENDLRWPNSESSYDPYDDEDEDYDGWDGDDDDDDDGDGWDGGFGCSGHDADDEPETPDPEDAKKEALRDIISKAQDLLND
jgi:hypothetical protein